MAVVKAPAGNVNRTIAGVTFVDGVAETTDSWALAYFTRAGYEVSTPALPADLTYEVEQDPATMTVAQLRDYAEANSIDIDGLTRKADILDAILLPGAPTSVSATAGDEEVVVSWTAPADTGPGTISSYEVEVLADGDDEEDAVVVEDASSPETVGDLVNDTEYQFRVRAINQYGTGPWSAPDTATPEAED